MKTLSLLALICLSIASCKKSEQPDRTVSITTTNISAYTTYTIVVNDNTTGGKPLNVSTLNGTGNQTFSCFVKKGDVLNMQYTFYTQGQQYGQGILDVTCQSQNLYHANGGSGQNIIITTP